MDNQLETIIRGIIRAERLGRAVPAAEALNRVTAEFASKGALGHGRYPVMLDLEASREYEYRANSWLNIVRRVASEAELPWTKDRAAEFGHLLETELLNDWDDLLAKLRQTARPGTQPRIEETGNASHRARTRIEYELNLLVYAQDRTRVPIAELLNAPRYASVLSAWNKARALLDGSAADYDNAAKEAVAAVEQLARIVTGNTKLTLGDAIKELRKAGKVEQPLLKGIEEIWGWSSEAPGVRHGSAAQTTTELATARYILAQADAAIGLLLTKDAA